jgi:hypothetical protein
MELGIRRAVQQNHNVDVYDYKKKIERKQKENAMQFAPLRDVANSKATFIQKQP